MVLAPTTNNVVALYSPYMDTDLCDMDNDNVMFRRRIASLAPRRPWSKDGLIRNCTGEINTSLFPHLGRREQSCQNITDEQIKVAMEMMNFLLLKGSSCEDSTFLTTILPKLIVFLLVSNKKRECEVWLREHMSELESLKYDENESILHKVLNMRPVLPIEPTVRFFVEQGKMDVNVENIRRQTPLHLISARVYRLSYLTKEDLRMAEIMKDNGAHMDAVDVNGSEASSFLKRFPQWSFNVSLKCLAARAVLKHGISYEKCADLIPFIESHKPGQLSQLCDNDDKKNQRKRKNDNPKKQPRKKKAKN